MCAQWKTWEEGEVALPVTLDKSEESWNKWQCEALQSHTAISNNLH